MSDTTEPAKALATEPEQWQFGINVPPVETLIRRYAIQCGETTVWVSYGDHGRWLVWSEGVGSYVIAGGREDNDLNENQAVRIAKTRAVRFERERLLWAEIRRQLADENGGQP